MKQSADAGEMSQLPIEYVMLSLALVTQANLTTTIEKLDVALFCQHKKAFVEDFQDSSHCLRRPIEDLG